jgi:hypothetical protein
MKKILTRAGIWLGLTVLMMVFWGIGLAIGFTIFPEALSGTATPEGNEGLMLFISSFLNAGAILFFIYNSQYRGWKLVGSLVLISFGIQYFMSQIETLWFNDSLQMDLELIFAVVLAGAIMYMLFSVAATWLTGRFKNEQGQSMASNMSWKRPVKRVIILAVLIWPFIYLFAGYFIAWQFADVREYYSDSVQSGSFLSIMAGNFTSGLYFFQILRGVLWILIALPVLMIPNISLIRKGAILGLLFSFLGASQLLLPNPIMPEMVRMAHLLETGTSNFVWGFTLVFIFGKAELVATGENEFAGINRKVAIN